MADRSKRNLTALTIRKMRKTIAAVKANAEFYDQEQFPLSEDRGTTCCAAGFAVWANCSPGTYAAWTKEHDGSGIWCSLAQHALGLPFRGDLFYSPNFWPDPYQKMYLSSKTAKGRAGAMEAYWEEFIRRDGDIPETQNDSVDWF